MIRQPSYRHIPTVSDFNSNNNPNYSDITDDDDDDVPGLEPSLDIDSFFDEDESYRDYKGTFDCDIQSKAHGAARKEKIGLFRGTYDGNPLERVSLEDFSAHTNEEDDDLSYDSNDYAGSMDGNENNQIISVENDDDVNVFTTGNRNISILLDDLLKEDDFSDSSEEDDGFYIEERPPKRSNGKKENRRRFLSSYNRRFSDTIMLVDHYSLHTIDEEGSLLSDETSRCSTEFGKALNRNQAVLQKVSHFHRSQSAPTPTTTTTTTTTTTYINSHNTTNTNTIPDKDNFQLNFPENKLSVENVKCFSITTAPSVVSEASSTQLSIKADIDIEGQENKTTNTLLSRNRHRSLSLRMAPYQKKKIIFVSSLVLSVFIILLVANSI